MRHTIATMALSGTLPAKMKAAADAGFDGVELFENDLLQTSLTLAQIRELAIDMNLEIDVYQPLRDFEGVSAAQLARNLDRAERKFDIIQALDIRMLGVCSNTQADASGDRKLIADQLAELAQRAALRDIRIGFESLSWGVHCSRWSHAWDAVKRANQPNLGLVLDSYHTLALRDDFSAIRDLPKEKIFFLQLSDAPFDTTSPPLHTRSLRTLPGLGQFDMFGFTEAVLQTGYDGPMSLEIFSDSFRGAPADCTAVGAKTSLIWLEEQVQQRRVARSEAVASTLAPVPVSSSESPLALLNSIPERAALQAALGWLGSWKGELIGQAVPANQLDAVSANVRQRFGANRQAPLLKHDPDGVTKGRNLFTSEWAIELETSEHSLTWVAQASIDCSFTKLAVSVPYLRAAWESIAHGMLAPLQPSTHYYDDLRARFGLSETEVNQLAALRCTYDRQGMGELRIITIPIGYRGFCLQLVQRTGGYPAQQWDAANAYVIVAALKSWLNTAQKERSATPAMTGFVLPT